VKILFIVPYVPTLIRTRPFNLLRSLAQRGHSLTLATLWETEAERAALQALAGAGVQVLARRLGRPQIACNVLSALASNRPLQALYCWRPELAGLLTRTIAEQRFDVVHVEHLRGAEYGLYIQAQLRQQRVSTPVVWDSVDCISLLFEQAARHSRSRFGRWVTRLELPRTRRYEAQAVQRFAGVLVTSPIDKAALEALPRQPGATRRGSPLEDVRRPIFVLPNGVDTDYFSPAAAWARSNQVILTGKMSYHANVTAALHLVNDIMPHVWGRLPDVQVVIAGQAPPREIRALAERHPSTVAVTGFVADLRPHLCAAAVAAAPIAYGAGIQNKVLEAMACGVPVVASPQASSALQARPERDLLVADTPAGFAAAIVRLLENPGLRLQLGAAGLQYVRLHHRWETITAQLEAFYEQCRESTFA
jgi:glycosyltransferase involved in cell wall biosynthesis